VAAFCCGSEVIVRYDNELRSFGQCFHALQKSKPEINRPSQLLTEIPFGSSPFTDYGPYLTANLGSCFLVKAVAASERTSTKELRSRTTGQDDKSQRRAGSPARRE
jgi:hypothetical protein